ncbi:D-glucuronyl C5-epimerase B-like [Ostrea edulis]|uniref:D-glucuronyl C5-epimerase B-like n=1 Tax=Ostrea edulis TaxID=37623 RepID=UPI002095CCF2|nr:D-glucuronyl C5-epimerase B-like [Ostrea edulis]XP_048775458.1 D-glucuronyl C5-epimerase B-like [Ostrea edulis]XP_048775462.1 D-glucuronyl C5-epimerase B-like [Ostrea edulis]XP_048775467.1 D-glucuronyl C5-epimerase B-like [Ostrea edulis]XP_048775473.1 D-glucuronyl C5-epimerase B-like [Ostrea edulis]XP_048775479.1 D-glucuronyl C5-epimerase B-like [Ostrea edulis]XP_056017510.1 D-glucuronyl C5-epimerase B-like [Ostrea edulis]XP_056017521.1 D-glucuronyl C5-epimerase B-like [Ostrea edulis]XP_
MPRANLKLLVACVGISILLVTVYNLGKCDFTRNDVNSYRDEKLPYLVNEFHDSKGFQPRAAQSYTHSKGTKPIRFEEIECVINGDSTVKGIKDGSEVYMPFSFIQKYFEVYGSLETSDGYERFSFHHSYQDDFPTDPQPKYSPSGVFMSFDLYSVEDRNRVKCVSGIEGVPISTQWDPKGHYYPIQIAQYGLSHYSKQINRPKNKVKILEDGERTDLSDWLLPDQTSEIRSKLDERISLDNGLVEFRSSPNLKNPGITISTNEKKLSTLSMDLKFINNGSVTVLIQMGDGNLFRIHYVLSDTVMRLDGSRDLYYGLGSSKKGNWFHFTRLVMVDFQKGLNLQYSKSRTTRMKNAARISAISVRGHGLMDNVTLSAHAHMDLFFDAANYLVRHQDSRGGWPVMVPRKLIPEVMELDPGWYSAMGQGQAISLLVRAYIASKDKKYIEAAGKALNIFDIPSSQGGITSKYLNSYSWYEEYPTTPSSFVLNGFIYSLIGLYDLKKVATGRISEKAEELFDNGMRTLKVMLLMFDTGTGTFYDLRHITASLAPNRARWDYHKVHINQILLLSEVDSDPLFSSTAERWKGYMKGKLSPHN